MDQVAHDRQAAEGGTMDQVDRYRAIVRRLIEEYASAAWLK